MPVWTRCAVLALAAASLCLFLLPRQGPGQDLLQSGVQACCLVLAWHHVLRRRSVLRLGWGLLTLAATVLALGDMTAALERHVRDLDARSVPSNVLALGGYLLLGLAVVQLERNRGRGRRLPGGTEAAIFATGVLTPMLVFLVIPVLQHQGLSGSAKAITVAYAVADLVIVTVIARLLMTDGRRSRSFVYLSAALFLSLAGDVWSWASTGSGPTSTAAAVKVLWLAGFVLFLAGVAHPSMETLTSGGAWSRDAPRRRRVRMMAAGQAMPASTLLLAWALDLTVSPFVVGVGGLVVSLLVYARLNGLLDQISDQSSTLSHLSRSDELTGLHNRRAWNVQLARACDTAAATHEPLAVALLDLDHFKSYNDSYGHPAGDRLLRAAAEGWSAALHPDELLARYGGEEFAMLLPGVEVGEALRRVDSLRAVTPGGQSFSAGVTVWVEGTDPAQAVADADAALYRAKRNGRDQVLAFEPRAPQAFDEIPYALSTVVQPIVRVRDLTVVSYEVLSRFHPLTDVEQVFQQAYNSGYGDVLESSAILSGLRFPDRPAGIELFVNVSERALVSAHFWQMMPPRLDGVVMELHETRHGLDDDTVAGLLDRFRQRGARVCLDDLVGSPDDLDRIVSLRPDLVKVDRSLVGGCDGRPEQVARIALLVDVARRHGVTVCAEGVETLEELATIRDLGVPYVQGYLLGRPEPFWVEPLQPALRVALPPGPSRSPVVTRTSAT